MKTKLVLALLCASIFSHAQSSRQVVKRDLVWGGVFAEYKFLPVLSASLDVQGRYEYTDGDWYQWLVRVGVWDKTKKGFIFGLGAARFSLYPNPNGKVPRPEWRPWEEAGYKFRFGHHTIYPRFRFEQRFIREYVNSDLADNFSFSAFRERFRIDYTYSFHPEKTNGFSIVENQEILIATKKTGFSALDAARFSLGIGYLINKSISLQLVYLCQLQQKDSEHFERQDIARFTLQLQFAKREKKSSGESGK
jgi:hypothetical protein